MSDIFFEPYVGKHYRKTKILLMSESAYDWRGSDGLIHMPQANHPRDSVEWNIDNFGKNQYFRTLNRVLCGKKNPSSTELKAKWAQYAYTIYVQQSVGQGAGVRPKRDHWKDASKHFLTLLEKLRPKKVIVTGVDMWNRMPDTSTGILDDLQAYRLSDKSLVWCLALPHPANRRSGFKWELTSEAVRSFQATDFPQR